MAREVFDIGLNDDYELLYRGGDFDIVESTERHQDLLLMYEPGQLKAYPTTGVGVGSHILNDTDVVAVEKDIEREFTADGMAIKILDVISLLNVRINAYYK